LALATLMLPPPASPPAQPQVAEAAPQPEPARIRPAGRWAVQVDGWYIELDDVEGRRPFPAPAPAVDVPALSEYDQMIARHAEAAGLDWRLVSAVIYEESRFKPDSLSDAGAYGLMQVMPVAAADVGELHFREPEANIRTGVRYMQRLARDYAAAGERDGQALMLAAYNMGMAHVQDAQRLARRFGYDALRWDGAMDVMVSLLEEPQVYEQMPAGFAQGRSVVAYVNRVLERYALYRREFPPVPPA